MGSSSKTKGAVAKGAVKAVSKAGTKSAAKAAAPALVLPEGGSAAPAANSKAAKEAKAESAVKTPKEKAKKPKLVRDSFAMPEPEYDVLRDLKKSCMKAGIDIKKSELLRVGIALLKKQTPADIQAALASLVPLKAGRPRKEAESAGQTTIS